MTELQSKWQKTFNINSYHVDANRYLTLPSLCHYFQEIAYEHAEHLNFGYHYLKSVKKFWVLSRLQLEVYKYPVWGDQIAITTWPRGMDGMFALREFLVAYPDGTRLAAATSSWLVLDEEKHFPQRIDPDDFVEFSKTKESVLNLVAEKLTKAEGAVITENFNVKFSDVDVNRHVNNGRYIQWAADALPFEVLLHQSIASFSINFLGEASFGDNLALWKEVASGTDFNISVWNVSRNKELCRVRIQLSGK